MEEKQNYIVSFKNEKELEEIEDIVKQIDGTINEYFHTAGCLSALIDPKRARLLRKYGAYEEATISTPRIDN